MADAVRPEVQLGEPIIPVLSHRGGESGLLQVLINVITLDWLHEIWIIIINSLRKSIMPDDTGNTHSLYYSIYIRVRQC
jgi:hypothetical protein